MKIALFSDIHANIDALNEVLKDEDGRLRYAINIGSVGNPVAIHSKSGNTCCFERFCSGRFA